MNTDENQRFAVISEKKNYSKPLYLHDLTFSSLMDDIVVPYQSQTPFFIDGVPVKSDELMKVKIIKQIDDFNYLFSDLHNRLRLGKSSGVRVTTEEYPIKFEALFREGGLDVTSQIIKAFDLEIKPSLKDYLPKREELIDGAFRVFMETMKFLGEGA